MNDKDILKEGLVTSYFGNSVAVATPDGQVFQCHLRRNQLLPVVGDRVRWHETSENSATIAEVLPRRTVLQRGDSKAGQKIIAANVDIIVIVLAPAPIFSTYLIDRYVLAAELLKIKPVVVINKDDLMTETERGEAQNALFTYQAIGYQTTLSSVIVPQGLSALTALIKQQSSVLVGPSGVGKSSIISALIGETIRTTAVSSKGAGKHTTTATSLYVLPGGGQLIDSPGVRDFNLWPVTKSEVLSGFIEFSLVKETCKFRDCMHLAEPGCAIKEALINDRIHPTRYQSYTELMKKAK